ncbi:MAG: glutamate--cysteine ligase [Bdellovibrionales bacterium CG12_big_fil_rev_8_21_14_0_65_38_15]|nr:MAG: glutamate--cysteine ligase [Bdellovibrionales bacterium CG22_combo_CG10-13_8_21_14_all_38_13]PIQ54518.1 MAG: glutamate--cysteine ligase [Bdellovibrionales bacterium CG12_big_fil_rev_8_21_14_0_65_38_15]PIR29899.1 MAG: glutamate--cysteine ligase [Bdellovibrionales bacterium CG11_big_fil_rev_8_21_14_0_20_38_13]
MINTKQAFEELITTQWNAVNAWIDEEMAKYPVPIYSSVDIRESKDKFAPVDHNMYPAGFNNVCALDQDACSSAFEKTINRLVPGAKSIAILPESNTKNLFYLDHLAILGKIIRDSGLEVSFISFDETIFNGEEKLNLLSHSKFDIQIDKAQLSDGLIKTSDKNFDMIILNNDQSKLIEVDWSSVKTPVMPTPMIGWFKRQKVRHFRFYKEVVDNFSKQFNIEPNLLMADFTCVDGVDFGSKEGLDKLAAAVDKVKSRIANKDAKIFVKGSQGTYGMGIMVVDSGEEVINMNRKARNKMDVGKNSIKFTTLLVQEGVETMIKYDEMPAEVTIYLVDGKGLGGFMRANGEKDSQANLNSRGMVFKKYCISEIRENQDHKSKEAVYSVVARLATLAAGYEIKEVL